MSFKVYYNYCICFVYLLVRCQHLEITYYVKYINAVLSLIILIKQIFIITCFN